MTSATTDVNVLYVTSVARVFRRILSKTINKKENMVYNKKASLLL